MAEPRSGRVTVPHRDSDTVILTRLGGMPQCLKINSILRIAEIPKGMGGHPGTFIIQQDSGFLVTESFDAVMELVNGGKAVPHA